MRNFDVSLQAVDSFPTNGAGPRQYETGTFSSKINQRK